MDMRSSLQIVILAGGTGTRLWPLSSEAKPKQFQQLVGKETLFQAAVKRARLVARPEQIFVATNERYVSEVRKQAPKIPQKNIIAEPAFRNTATCLGYAAQILENKTPGGVMAVLYADNLIGDPAELKRKLLAAAKIAEKGKLAIIEVRSEYPATQLGWVQTGCTLTSVHGEKVLEFKGFKEKPNLEEAKEFHQDKDHLWNTGLYVWRTDILLSKYREHLPATARRLKKAVASKNKITIKKEYSACEKISIDYGIMEKVRRTEVMILPARLGWSDVGTWAGLKDKLSKKGENLIDAQHIGVETTDCLIRGSKKKLIATIGLKNFVIVDTPKILLICPKGRAEEVKQIVEKLK